VQVVDAVTGQRYTGLGQAHVGALPQDGTGSPANQVQLSAGNVAVHPK
jgi:hypothetical protein